MPILLLVLLLVFVCPPMQAKQLSLIVDELSMTELADTFGESKVESLLGDSGKSFTKHERRAAAALVSAGVLSVDDLDSASLIQKGFDRFKQGKKGKGDHLIGPFGAGVTHARLNSIGGHAGLLQETTFIKSLQKLLSEGVITGYDLRKVNINGGFDPDKTLTYSHSSILHLKQLSALLRSERIEGLLYAAPKVSAFLFRDEWGEPGANVVTLEDGTRVVNGREWVVFFEFENSDAKHEFHRVVTRYAKKDSEDEKGLIAGAWWQPFYYSDTKVADFEHINLVLLRSETTEATLTVLPTKTASVKSALGQLGWEMTVEDVWVNKPFYRFLQGGYK